jgi:hypothetical protein
LHKNNIKNDKISDSINLHCDIESLSDKQKLVMKLLEENKSFQEIARKVHVSFTLLSFVKMKIPGRPFRLQTIINTYSCLKVIFWGQIADRSNNKPCRLSLKTCKYHEEYLSLSVVDNHYHWILYIIDIVHHISIVL